MTKTLIYFLLLLPATVIAADSYKIYSINQSVDFFSETTTGGSQLSLGEKGPGPTTFTGNGDEQAGFYGETPVSELFSGDDLASNIGLSEGTTQYSNEPWLKFAYKEKLLYVAKKPYRKGVSWDSIANANAVYGGENGKTVSTSGYTFKVRLLTGATNDPTQWSSFDNNSDPVNGKDSEWNDLIYRIHQQTPTNQEGSNWANYSDSDIFSDNGGNNSWCQETEGSDAAQRVIRGGGNNLIYFGTRQTPQNLPGRGWRPVLELEAQ